MLESCYSLGKMNLSRYKICYDFTFGCSCTFICLEAFLRSDNSFTLNDLPINLFMCDSAVGCQQRCRGLMNTGEPSPPLWLTNEPLGQGSLQSVLSIMRAASQWAEHGPPVWFREALCQSWWPTTPMMPSLWFVMWWASCTAWQNGHFVSAKWRALIPIFLANREVRGTYNLTLLFFPSSISCSCLPPSLLFPTSFLFLSFNKCVYMGCKVMKQTTRNVSVKGLRAKHLFWIFITMSQMCWLL